jgi:hypothetical protein
VKVVIVVVVALIVGAALLYEGFARSSRNPGGTASSQPTRVDPMNRTFAQVIDPRRLASDPDSFKGRNIIIQGKAQTVTQHSDYTWVQVMAQVPERNTAESIVVEVRPKDPNLIREECYRFYGMGGGTQTVTRQLTGAENKAALINGYWTEEAPRGRSNIGCADP